MHAYRTHSCGELRESHVGERVKLSGWVHRKRDHGNLLFVDLRDHYGSPRSSATSPTRPSSARRARVESVITVEGEVVRRDAEAINPNLATGQIEIHADKVEIQSAAQELPLPVFGDQEYPEEFASATATSICGASGCTTTSSAQRGDQLDPAADDRPGLHRVPDPDPDRVEPEGARDYLVPSRVHPGKFYALPQAPQMFKQLIMVAGFDRYFQIAPCFRDEDARADRSPASSTSSISK
jgi:aspartyl-tRNA synthetase